MHIDAPYYFNSSRMALDTTQMPSRCRYTFPIYSAYPSKCPHIYIRSFMVFHYQHLLSSQGIAAEVVHRHCRSLYPYGRYCRRIHRSAAKFNISIYFHSVRKKLMLAWSLYCSQRSGRARMAGDARKPKNQGREFLFNFFKKNKNKSRRAENFYGPMLHGMLGRSAAIPLYLFQSIRHGA